MSYTLYMMASNFSSQPWLMVLVLIWSIPWKGVALWKAAKKNDLPWFVVLLIVNTLGILEILYIYLFSRWSSKSKK